MQFGDDSDAFGVYGGSFKDGADFGVEYDRIIEEIGVMNGGKEHFIFFN